MITSFFSPFLPLQHSTNLSIDLVKLNSTELRIHVVICQYIQEFICNNPQPRAPQPVYTIHLVPTMYISAPWNSMSPLSLNIRIL